MRANIGAQAPAVAVTEKLRCLASRTSLKPGSEIKGVPASLTSPTFSPFSRADMIRGRITSPLWS